MPRKRKSKSDELIVELFALLASAFFVGLRYIVLFSVQVLKIIFYCIWRILLFTIVSLIEYFERRSLKRKLMILDKEKTIELTVSSNEISDLNDLYKDYYPKLIDSIGSINGFERKISYPLLICPFDSYFKSKRKIMFIGKETHFWILNEQDRFLKDTKNNDEIIQQLLLNYKNFNYGQKYVKSPFWQFCHKLYKDTTLADNRDGFIWSNLSKVDENGTTPKWDVTKASTAFYPIIQNEIRILKPDVVIFLTGNGQDPYLKYLFEDIQFISINSLFSRVSHKDLPYHSYRTSHPKKHRLSKTFDKVIKELIFEIVKENPDMVEQPILAL